MDNVVKKKIIHKEVKKTGFQISQTALEILDKKYTEEINDLIEACYRQLRHTHGRRITEKELLHVLKEKNKQNEVVDKCQ